MAESMEKVAKRAVNKCKEDLGIPFGSSSATSNKDKKNKDKKVDKKSKKEDDDPMAEEKSDESGSEKSGSDSEEDEEDADEVPFEQKVQFTEKVRRLTNDGLTKLVK
jgi:hypothetical protein